MGLQDPCVLELVMLSEDTDDFSIKWMKTVEGDRKGVWLMEKRGAPSPPTHPHPFSPVQNDQATPRQGLHNFPPVMQTIFIVLGNPGLLSCPATFSIFMNLTENDIYWLWQCPPFLDDLVLWNQWNNDRCCNLRFITLFLSPLEWVWADNWLRPWEGVGRCIKWDDTQGGLLLQDRPSCTFSCIPCKMDKSNVLKSIICNSAMLWQPG